MAIISFRVGVSRANRSSHAIIADIMKQGLSGTLQTHIMYRANLSYSPVKDYLSWVQSSGLMIRRDDDIRGKPESFFTSFPKLVYSIHESIVLMSKDSKKEGKEKEPVIESDEVRPVEEVPRTNTGVEIDNPEEMEEAGKKD